MSLPMLETLRTETARVKLSLVRTEDAGGTSAGMHTDRYGIASKIPPFTFLSLHTKVFNLSASELILTLNLTLDPSQHVIAQGVLKEIPLGRVRSGEASEVHTPVAFVSCGKFELAADVYASWEPAGLQHVGQGRLNATVMLDNT